jgi:NADH-quinone oxidoreductase subunit E
VISDATRSVVEDLMTRFPEKRGALLPALHLVQRELGCVAPETALHLADWFEVAPVEVLELVRFYDAFDEAPQARHRVGVCTNLSCSLRGARGLLRQLEAHLGVHSGEATADGRIRLREEECLGACAGAPMLRIDERYHEELDADAAKRLLDELE